MIRKSALLFVVLALFAVALAACGPNAATVATMTAMANDLNNAKTQLNQANAQVAELQTQLDSAYAELTKVAPPPSPVDGLYGNWIDEVGDTWNFKKDGTLDAVASGKPVTTTWYAVDNDTIVIDFGPVLDKVGDPNAILTLTFVISGDSLTLTFANGSRVPLTRVK